MTLIPRNLMPMLQGVLLLATPLTGRLAHADEWNSEPSAVAYDEDEAAWSSGDPAGVYDDSEGAPPDDAVDDVPGDPSSWRSSPPPQQPNGYTAQGFTPSQSTAPMEQSQFEQVLNPHGRWVQVDGLGRVWQPAPAVVGADFTPYVTGGSWVYSPAGWSFQSQWNWGWATFHYGRWYRSPAFGWVWWPNRVWGPSWVDWRCSGAYVGWAPLPPPGFSISFGFGNPGWSFASYGSFGRPYIARHLVYPRRYFGPAYGGYRGGWGWYRSPGWRHGPGWSSPRHFGGHPASGAWSGPRHAPGHWGTSGRPGHGGGPMHGAGRPMGGGNGGHFGGGHPGGGGGHFGGGGHSGHGGGHGGHR